MTHEEPLDWMFEKELQELGLMPKKVDDKIKQDSADKNPAKAAVNRKPRDTSWYHRGEECPH